MSDDTPTQAFDPHAADAPTERFAQPAAPGTSGTPPRNPEKKSKTMIILLSVIGGLLLVAVIVLLTLLFARGFGGPPAPTPDVSSSPSASALPSPSASPSVSPSPSATPSTAPSPQPPAGPTFATFTAPSAATCTDANPTSQITFTWSSTNAVKAWFGVHTTNAKAAPFEEVPTTASYTFDYQCSNASEFYTVTLEDASGNLTHKTVTITKN
ncbi:MAG TPA: hypothetical protein VIQ78_00780 [Terrimesophilobacter sp.]|uniref:hypothetical protein n=1 Tax=Terrimesophilobacter sp. TaxID=2906435 RepID=UPI002F928236